MRRVFSVLFAVLFVISLSVTAFASEARFSPEEVEFPFLVTLRDASGNELAGEFEYTGDRTGTIQSGHVIWLSDGETVDIIGLPEGTNYVVSELSTSGYRLKSSVNTEGVIETGVVSEVVFENDEWGPNIELPESGGSFAHWVLLCIGAMVSFCIGVFMYVSFRHRA